MVRQHDLQSFRKMGHHTDDTEANDARIRDCQKDIDGGALYSKYKTMTPATVKAAATMVITLPIVMVYPFFQKYFIAASPWAL